MPEAQHVGAVPRQPCGDLRHGSGEEQVVPVEEEQIRPPGGRRTGVAGGAGVEGGGVGVEGAGVEGAAGVPGAAWAPGAVRAVRAVRDQHTHPGVLPGYLPGDGEVGSAAGRTDDDQLDLRPVLPRRLPGHGLQGGPQVPLNAVGGHDDTEEHGSRA